MSSMRSENIRNVQTYSQGFSRKEFVGQLHESWWWWTALSLLQTTPVVSLGLESQEKRMTMGKQDQNKNVIDSQSNK